MGYVMRIIKNQNYGQKYSGIERVQTRKGVGDGGEQLQFRPQKIRCGYPGHAPDKSAEPLPAYPGVPQGHGSRQPSLR